jgi:hypothetical protein
MLKIVTLILALLALLAGCASTPQGSRERDADAKQFVTHPNASTLYVYRSQFDRLEDEAVLYVDQRLVGQTLPGGYFRVDTVPGHHVLHGMGVDIGKFELDTRPGELYFIELTVIEGHSHFWPVSEAVGRRRIVECCALLENWAPGQRPLFR